MQQHYIIGDYYEGRCDGDKRWRMVVEMQWDYRVVEMEGDDATDTFPILRVVTRSECTLQDWPFPGS